jgi:hypothetical protein
MTMTESRAHSAAPTCTRDAESETAAAVASGAAGLSEIAVRSGSHRTCVARVTNNCARNADGLVRVGHELAVVDAYTPVVDGAKPAVLRVARAIRVAPAVQIAVDLQTSASVGVDVLVAAAHAVGASVRVVGDSVGVGVKRSSGGHGAAEEQRSDGE